MNSASQATRPRPLAAILRDYAALAKPGITFMALVTALLGYGAGAVGDASEALLDPWRLLGSMAGIVGVVGGASALNQVIERDADAKMRRAMDRPIPAGRISWRKGLAFGLALSVAGLLCVGAWGGALAFLAAAIGWVFYALVYTPMKQLTSAATIVGAVPGALPPVIGWAAARGDLSYGAWLLFAILFLWQFPHFLALGWMYREDYLRGGMPVLAHSDPTGAMSRRQAFAYAMALIPVSLLPVAVGMAGPLYFVSALGLGIVYAKKAWQCHGPDIDRRMRSLFLFSIIYWPAVLGVAVSERLAMLAWASL